MAVEIIKLPNIGDFKDVEIIEVLVKPGDELAADDTLFIIESDKATMDIPCPMAGKLISLSVKVGDKVNKGDVIGEMEVEAQSAVAAPVAEPQAVAAPAKTEVAAAAVSPAPTPVAAPAATAAPGVTAEKPLNKQALGAVSHATPSVRLFARRLGVDLSKVVGTAPKGRITQQDVEGFVKSVITASPGLMPQPASSGAGIPPVPVIDFSQFGEVEAQELKRIQKISGKHLHTAWLNVPHVTQFDETDITDLEAFRQSLKAQAEKAGVKVTPLVFTLKAVAKVLEIYPRFNASLSPDGESLLMKKYIHIGVAVDTPNGLVVPVVRDVNKKGIFELSKELMEISARARDGKLSPADMSGGCFTISSLGGIGGTQFTPIVNAPEVAILGVSKAKMQPVWDGKAFQPRLMMPFSLSYDHRVIDGALGVRFTTTLGQVLNDLRQLIL